MSLFGIGRKRDERRILAIKIELRSGEKLLPEPLSGAFVTAFSFAEDPTEAAQKSFRAAIEKGTLAKVLPEGFSLPVHQWREYIESQWPEFANQMPAQSEIGDILSSGAVVFGPLIGFE